jgi:23S rRNA G2069 N7-methylase RlmK/C1962 C5-methylase RlmI
LPHADESFDIIVTDPPWGHRHMKSSQLNKQYHAWIREWSRVLKPGGLLVISTITSRIVEDKMNVAKKFELVEKSRFDNMGFTVCTCFIYRKAHA